MCIHILIQILGNFFSFHFLFSFFSAFCCSIAVRHALYSWSFISRGALKNHIIASHIYLSSVHSFLLSIFVISSKYSFKK